MTKEQILLCSYLKFVAESKNIFNLICCVWTELLIIDSLQMGHWFPACIWLPTFFRDVNAFIFLSLIEFFAETEKIPFSVPFSPVTFRRNPSDFTCAYFLTSPCVCVRLLAAHGLAQSSQEEGKEGLQCSHAGRRNSNCVEILLQHQDLQDLRCDPIPVF